MPVLAVQSHAAIPRLARAPLSPQIACIAHHWAWEKLPAESTQDGAFV